LWNDGEDIKTIESNQKKVLNKSKYLNIDLAVWCQNNNLSLNVTKTKEMIVDYRKRRTKHAPILIDGL
jgi:hypothetical protein